MNDLPPLYERVRAMHDRDYSKREYFFGTKQSRLGGLLAKELPAKNTVLDLGTGEGRDAIYLAREGHNVTAVDLSPEGIKKLENRARKRKLSIDTIVANIADKDFIARIGMFDAIIAQGVLQFLTPEDVNIVLGYIKEKIKPGGYAAIQAIRGTDSDYKRFEALELYNIFDGWNRPFYAIYTAVARIGKPFKFVEILAQKPTS